MVIMFSAKQEALIFIQLVNMWSVFAAIQRADHTDVQVSRGETALFTCNISKINLTLISWTKDRFVIAYSFTKNHTSSTFSSRVTIDTNIPTNLSISNTQHDDAGLYTCTITDTMSGINNITWNLTVTENQTEFNSPKYFLFTLLPAIGLPLCFILTAVTFCRNCGTRKARHDPVRNQTRPWSEGEEVPTQLEGSMDHWRNTQQRSEYMERLNSIYGHI